MGLHFRKSFGKGPFRTTISKNGVSVSVGGNGIRVGSYASSKSKKSTQKRQVVHSSTILSENTEINNFGWKILAWLCRIVWIPMILLGALLALVEPTIGIMTFVVGVFECIYSHQYFKKNNRTKTVNDDTKLMEVQNSD